MEIELLSGPEIEWEDLPPLSARQAALARLIDARLFVHKASEVIPKPRRWLWKDLIPEAEPSLLAGEGGLGKSTFATMVAARLSTGTAPGDFQGQPLNILYLTAEDSWTTTQRARLELAGADLDRISLITLGEGEFDDAYIPKLKAEKHLYADIFEVVRPSLLVLDNVGAAAEEDTNQAFNVRQMLMPFISLARKYHSATLLLHHVRKGDGSIRERVSGSHSFADSVRSLIGMGKDALGNPYVGLVKGNYAQPNTISWKLQRDIVPYEFENMEYSEHPVFTGADRIELGLDAAIEAANNGEAAPIVEASGHITIRAGTMSEPLPNKIIRFLEQAPGHTLGTEIWDRFSGQNKRSARFAMEELVDNGVVVMQVIDRKTFYTLPVEV